MESSRLPLPESFDKVAGLNQAEQWPKWSLRFERYRVASGLASKPDSEQVSTLLYAMGECADDIIVSLNVKEETAKYDDVIATLKKYFNVRKNIIVERAKFNKRTQRPGESVDTFINDLYRLAEDCDYDRLKEGLIRDRIVVGVLDDSLSDQLQSREDLTLSKAVQLSRQSEARKQNKSVVRGGAESESPNSAVNYVRPKSKGTYSKKTSQTPQGNCKWCGRQNHARASCPAKDAKCHQCGKMGHFQSVCQAKQPEQGKQEAAKLKWKARVSEVDDFDDIDVPFLGEVSENDQTYWSSSILVDGNETHFKLDTGAAVTVLSDSTPWLNKHIMRPTTKRLRGPGSTVLTVIGQMTSTLRHRDKQIKETLYVVKDQESSLLSRKACRTLNLVRRVEEVDSCDDETANFKAEFPQLFTGLGKLKTAYHITLTSDAKPMCLYTARKVPHPLLPKVKKELESMLKQNVISKVTEPTKWCSGMVPVLKPSGSVRICVDLTSLNKAVEREIHPMSSVDESLAKLGKSTIFTKLDANSGFWQIPLEDESKLLTTFVTPFGRFCFNRLPFGITSAPEVFQRAMSTILEGLDGVICHMDDVLVHGATQTEHDIRVRAVLQRLQEAGITLNQGKCEFSKQSVKFLGHFIDDTGVKVDPSKTRAIRDFPVPRSVKELQRFMGMVNQVGKFLPGLAEINEPLRQLLKKDNVWCWGEAQQRSFTQIKEMMVSTAVLAHYDPELPTVIAADASGTGMGAILYQVQTDGNRRPVCYASRSLTETEQRYAVIEKEALAATWACERFSEYVLGLHFEVETDHKPLVTLLNSKELVKMPPRLQRFRMRMMRFDAETLYVPGKQQTSADALSRAPVERPGMDDVNFVDEVESYASTSAINLPVTMQRFEEIRNAQKTDEVCAKIRDYCVQGWPDYMPHNPILKHYYEQRGHLSVVEDLLIYDERIVIPRALRLDILERLHQGHLGITKCRARARDSVWWPGLSKSLEDMISSCLTCAIHRQEVREPLMSSSFPSRPWERLGMDLFELKGKSFLIVVDYYSRWIEVKQLQGQSTMAVISSLKEIFAVHGIPDLVVSDNGPQFANENFRKLAEEYGFVHTTSSPRYPQANGEAERGVRTVKALLKKNDDIQLALLSYRASPLQNGLAPCELLMGRRLQTQVPTLPHMLLPRVQQPDLTTVREKEEKYRSDQMMTYNRRHDSRELPELQPGDSVWIRDQSRYGKVTQKAQQPRSYHVQTELGTVRRNRRALIAVQGQPTKTRVPESSMSNDPERPDDSDESDSTGSQRNQQINRKQPEGASTPTAATETRTRSGRLVKPPKRLSM
ncbi:uncharacterized protein K02A2.6-like [Strongylocentrotus purpuratus]|uniref:Endonuclease n=1 Tax=Strongylocentrotus purpuratus TaxID=7668 RepID=A0A7M7SSR8_STRPU|nr:uncharacterized protein K02A2.6-like [Strongylocentrotus purpuratus]